MLYFRVYKVRLWAAFLR